MLEVFLQTQVWSQAVSQPAVIGRPMRRHTIGPLSSGLGEGLAVRGFLVPSRSSDSLWQAGCLQADFSRQLYAVSSDTLVRLASGLSEQCVKKQCWQGRASEDACLSRVRTGVAVMGQDCNYQLDITKLGRNESKKNDIIKRYLILTHSIMAFLW